MTKFSDLSLDEKVLQAISDAGYETPTPIQSQAIPPALDGRDVLGIAQTGTGKTASYTLPMITRLANGRARARMPRSLVLCPTRELAAQVAENFDTYTKYLKLTKALLIGGVSFKEQDLLIDRGVDVLIATPGRLLDHFERGKLLLTGVQIMVVDEADRMLDMGFIPDIERIFTLTPAGRQTLFFSATMAPEIERITKTFLKDPARIEVARQASASETIEQRLIAFAPSRRDRAFGEKRALLRELIRKEGDGCTNAIIFCNRKMDVDVVAKSLKAHGFNAAPIHGDLDQSQRTKTLDSFRDGSLRLLVASDVAARGLDIPAVSHVFNFDVPSHAEDYIHRIGRTGRAGRLGVSITISTPADDKYLAAIESLIKTQIPRAETPAVEFDDSPDRGEHRQPRSRHPSRDRDRERPRRGDREAPRAEVAEPAPAVVAEVVAVAAPAPEPARTARRDERPRDDRPARDDRPVRDDRPARDDRPRDGRRDDRRDRRRDDRSDGPTPAGMGDHVPDFILRSFARVAVIDTPDSDDTAAAE